MPAADRLIFRSIYVDCDTDAAVRMKAAQARLTNAEMLRRCLRRGLAKAHSDQPQSSSAPGTRLIARSVFLPLELDLALKARAYDFHTEEDELVRRLLRSTLSE